MHVTHLTITGGVYAALVTPFDESEALDLPAFQAIVECVVGCGVHGIVVAGSTGESHALDAGEKERLWRAAVQGARGRCQVVAGTGATTTREAARLQKVAADCGCSAAMAITPWFAHPTPEAVLRYYAELAELTTIPLILYHIPSLTGLDWPPEAVAAVARELRGAVIGLKDATGDSERVRIVRKLVPEGFLIFAGGPHQRTEYSAAGTDGCIDSLATALPAEAVAAWNGEARSIDCYTKTYAQLSCSQNFIAMLKYAMSGMGLPAGRPRRPHDGLSDEEKKSAARLSARVAVHSVSGRVAVP